MDKYLPIDKNPGLHRHLGSHAVVNTDVQARNRYIIQKEKILADKQKLDTALDEIQTLKEQLSQLTKLVIRLTENQLNKY
jgi:hypothetical protein